MAALLKEFCNLDIDWFLTHGKITSVPAETIIHHPDLTLDHFSIVLEGGLGVFLPTTSPHNQSHNQSQNSPSTSGNHSTALELNRIPSGDCWGNLPQLHHFLPPAVVKTLLPSKLLSVPAAVLAEQCDRTPAFAARLYKTAAQLLSNRVGSIAQRCGYSLNLLSQLHLKEAATVFGALEDSDLDWFIAVGERCTIAPDQILAQRGRPFDQFYIVLEGALALTAPEQLQSPVLSAFVPSDLPEQEFSRVSRGSLLGEALLVDTFPPLYTVRALRDTQVLAIPRWRLMARLLYDGDFAARLYQVLALLLANQQLNLLQQMGYRPGPQELDHERLAHMSLAEARFDWMVKRLQTSLRR